MTYNPPFFSFKKGGDSVWFNLRYWMGFWSGLASSAKSKDKKIWSFVSFPVKLSTKKNREEGGLEQVRREGSGSRDLATCKLEEEGEKEWHL